MKQLKKEELKNINGGAAFPVGKWTILFGVATFIIGVINGYQRPLMCTSSK